MEKPPIADFTLVELLIYPDPVIRRLMQQIINRLDQIEEEKTHEREKQSIPNVH